MKEDSMPNPYSAKRIYAVVKETTPAPDPAETANAVPEGTANEILTWVDEDVDRAVQALGVEEGSDKPRKTLVAKLEDIING